MEGELIFRTPETAAVSAVSHDMYFPWLRNNRRVNVGSGGGRGVASRVSRHVRDLIWKNLIDSHPLPCELTKKDYLTIRLKVTPSNPHYLRYVGVAGK